MADGLCAVVGMVAVISTHAVAAVAGAVVSGLLVWQIQGARLESVKADWSKEREHLALQLADAQAEARKTEVDLATTADKLRKDAHAKQTTLARQRDDLARRLRQLQADHSRMPSTADAPGTGESAQRSDVAVLHGQVGYDVVSEAWRADSIRLQLAKCEAQYDAARQALNPR